MVEQRPDFINREQAPSEETLYGCSLWASGSSVNIYTDIPELQRDLSSKLANFKNVIPGLAVTNAVSSNIQSLYVLGNPETGFYYDPETALAYLFGNKADFSDGQAIAWTSAWLMEREKQENSLFTLHSSALAFGKKGVLLLGHSGAGKTSIMLNLCQRYPATIVSNDLTVVRHDINNGQLSLVDGAKEIRLRLSSVEKNFPRLKHLFHETKISPWETKIVVMPEDIGLKSEAGNVQLSAIFEVHLDSRGKERLFAQRENQIPIRYRLYEDMSRIIRGSAISTFDSKQKILGYMPSLDSAQIHGKRVACIEQIVDKTGITSISGGNIDEISQTLHDLTFAQK